MRTLSLIVLSFYIAHAAETKALFPIQRDGKWGFIDQTGNEVVSPKYDQTLRMTSGLAPFRVGTKWGFIDGAGQVVMPPTIEGGLPPTFCKDVAPYAAGGKFALLTSNGELKNYEGVDRYTGCGEGMISIRKSRKWGFVGKSGIVVEPSFDDVRPFHDGLAGAQLGGKWGLIDLTGSWVVKPQFSRVGMYSEGLAPVAVGEAWGFVDRTGKMVIAPKFASALAFSDGRAAVTVLNAENVPTHGFIDRDGKLIVPAAYRGVSDYHNERAMVFDGKGYGYIDKSGKVAIPLANTFAGEFQGGLAAVRRIEGGKEREMYINPAGRVVWRSDSAAK